MGGIELYYFCIAQILTVNEMSIFCIVLSLDRVEGAEAVLGEAVGLHDSLPMRAEVGNR